MPGFQEHCLAESIKFILNTRSQKPIISCYFSSVPCLPGQPKGQPCLPAAPAQPGLWGELSPVELALRPGARGPGLLALPPAAHSERPSFLLEPKRHSDSSQVAEKQTKKKNLAQQVFPQDQFCPTPGPPLLTNLTKFFLDLKWSNLNSSQPGRSCVSLLWLP